MGRKNKVFILSVWLAFFLILLGTILFFDNNYKILKLTDYTVEFPDNQNLSAKLYLHCNGSLLVVTEKGTHKTQGFFLCDGYNFIGIASFSKYLPFMKYAITGLHESIEPSSFMGRFDSDVNIEKGRIIISVKGVHPEAKDWLPEQDAKKYLIYQQKFILIKQ